jgi:hypothetical protein
MKTTRLAVLFMLVTAVATGAEAPWEIVRQIRDFDRFDMIQPGLTYALRKNNELRVEGTCVSGSAECDVEVPETGWYELLADPEGGLNEFVVDGRLSLFAGEQRKTSAQDRFGKVDNVWLTRGQHTVRVQRHIWWGFFPATRAVCLRRSDASVARTMRIEYAHGPGEAVLRRGQPLTMIITTAGRRQPATLAVQLREKSTGQVASTASVELPAGSELTETRVQLPCPAEGVFEVALLEGARPISTRDLRPMSVYVIDTTPVRRTGGELRRTLVDEIDCAAREPDYVSGGPAEVVSRPWGKYRISGDSGFLHAQHNNLEESWFAYKIATAAVGKPHLVEVDYPDDDFRTFLIVVREQSPDAYPVAGGVDTGGCWSLSNSMQVQSILFWPRSQQPRIALLTPHNGRRAAAARIRVYHIDGEIPPLDVPATGGRTFLNWYEEGTNFAGFYGGKKGPLADFLPAADLWNRSLCYMGGNMILPTVSVYQMNLHPSRYNNLFAEPASADVVRLLLLHCEKYGTRLAGEFHPEARELETPLALKQQRENGLASRHGQIAMFETGGPRHHPLHPRNQEWYLGMIGEMADRYKDSPAFAGVSLRAMTWSNPGLNNFHSLEWGYDDVTIDLFERGTGISLPGDPRAADRFARRYEWLLANARQKWIDWRCEKITELHRKIVARVRQARKDLVVYLNDFDLGEEAGLDPKRLTAIDGLVPINSGYSYGRQAFTYKGFLADQEMRDRLLDPRALRGLGPTPASGASVRGSSPAGSATGSAAFDAYLFGSLYFEATERILKLPKLGLAPDKQNTWISGVVNPAGRHYLERFAVALAETDALVLGDGGNAYTLGQPLLREFLREFRRLPPVHFSPRKDARDPVAVWELAQPEGLTFYAVNRECYPAKVKFVMVSGGEVKRLSTGQSVAMSDGQFTLELQPYQLIAFEAPAGSRIVGVSTSIPPEARQHVADMAASLEKLSGEVTGARVPLATEGRELLKSTLDEVRACLGQGRYWRARTMLEHHRLAQLIYNPTMVFPPSLEHLMDPRKARLLAARDLTKPKDPLVHLAFDRIEGGKTPVSGRLSLEGRCEGGCELADGRFGKAVRLDGKTGRVVLQGPDVGRLSLKGFTLSVWINAESFTERKGLLQRQKWPAGAALLCWNGSVSCEVGDSARQTECRTSDSLCSPGNWYHLAATVESGKAIVVYVDGQEARRAELKGDVAAVDGPMLIGWNSWGGRQNDSSPGFWMGRIDDLKIWDRALTADEILAETAGKE